tara:strand:- start:1041 stop:1565 length:525 start_codon:yes stop_codon:yes gene_type:complete
MEFITKLQNILEEYLSNEYVLALTKLLIILYTCLVAPTLPVEVLSLFDNTLIKILVLTLIFYTASLDPLVSILLGIGLFVTLQTLNNVKLLNLVNDQIEGLEVEEQNIENNVDDEIPANKIDNNVDDEIPSNKIDNNDLPNIDNTEEGCYPSVTVSENHNNNLKSYEGEDFSNF